MQLNATASAELTSRQNLVYSKTPVRYCAGSPGRRPDSAGFLRPSNMLVLEALVDGWLHDVVHMAAIHMAQR